MPQVLHTHPLLLACLQLALVIPILILNRNYFTVGFSRLVKLSPNMDSLVAVGAAAGLVYSLIEMGLLTAGQVSGMPDLYFESAGMILTLVTVGIKLKERKQVRRKMTLTYRISMIISVPAAVGISALGPQIIHMLFPSASDGGTLLTVGGVSIIFLALCQTSTGILQGIGHIKVPVVGAILGAITKVILNMVLIRIPSINVLGAVLSTTGCYLVAGVFDVIMLSRLTGTKFDIMGSFLKPIIGSAAMAAATLGSYHVFYQLLQSNTIATLLAICIAVAVYGLVMLLIKGIVEEDLQTVPGGGKLIRVCRRLHLL